jgi:hypothetical protein
LFLKQSNRQKFYCACIEIDREEKTYTTAKLNKVATDRNNNSKKMPAMLTCEFGTSIEIFMVIDFLFFFFAYNLPFAFFKNLLQTYKKLSHDQSIYNSKSYHKQSR